MPVLTVTFTTEDETLREMCRRYWEQREDGTFAYTVKALAAEFGYAAHTWPALVCANSVATDTNTICACGNVIERAVKSRADLKQRYWTATTCAECKSREILRQKEASRQQELARAEIRRQLEVERQRRKDYYWKEFRSCMQPWRDRHIDDLPLDLAVKLAAAVRALGSDEIVTLYPVRCSPTSLAPTEELAKEVIMALWYARILAPNPESDPAAFVTKEDGTEALYVDKVSWLVAPCALAPTPAVFYQQLQSRLARADQEDQTLYLLDELQIDVALHECLEFLRIRLQEHGFEISPTPRLMSVLRTTLERFSVAEVYPFIWRATKDVASFHLQGHSKQHAVNIVPGNIERSADRCIARGWEVTKFQRSAKVPLSALTHTLFTTVLKVPNDGFDIRVPVFGSLTANTPAPPDETSPT